MLWYILEIDTNPAGSTRMDSANIAGCGTSLLAAQNNYVHGYCESCDGMVDANSMDFAQCVQMAHAGGRSVIALQAPNGLKPFNK